MNREGGFLEKILASKRLEVEEKRLRVPATLLASRVDRTRPGRGFQRAIAREGVSLICEVKRRSPSGGELRDVVDPGSLARAYEEGGARALSVLTDGPFFGARDGDLESCLAASRLPVLRKDFLIDPYQVLEAKAMGADAILLIARALPGGALRELYDFALEWSLEVFAEAHDEGELDRVLDLANAIVGINNRDLTTMVTDLAVTERLAERVPSGRLIVSESGIESPADIRRLAAAGVSAFLVGTSLLRSPKPGGMARQLAGALG